MCGVFQVEVGLFSDGGDTVKSDCATTYDLLAGFIGAITCMVCVWKFENIQSTVLEFDSKFKINFGNEYGCT